MSKYNHYFNTQDAKDHGVIEAIILAHMKFWLEKNKSEGSNIKDGRVWTFNSYKAFASHFDYLTEKQVRRAIIKLEDAGVLVSASYNRWPGDKTKWYSINTSEYLVNQEDESHCPKEDVALPKWAEPLPEKAEPSDQMGRTIPDINTDSKQQIKNTDTFSLRQKTDWFIDFWNRKHGTDVKHTDKKQKQVSARLKIFTSQEIIKAINNRLEDDWFHTEGIKFLGDWDSFWRNDEKVERYLNRKENINDDLPF
jgi:hypothetical protein